MNFFQPELTRLCEQRAVNESKFLGGLMRKNLSYIVIAFLLGILVTQHFLNTKPADKNDVAQNEVTKDQSENQQPTPNPKSWTTVIKTVPVDSNSTINAIPNPHPNVKHQQNDSVLDQNPEAPNNRVVELTLNDATIDNLEQNINDLFVKVNLHREERGWRVNYMTENNVMASTGIRNNDLILYDLIESGRQNPTTKSLISRLENILETLQK